MTTKVKNSHPFAKLLDDQKGLKIYKAGDLVEGIITATTKNRIWIDIDDGHLVGIVSNKELFEEGIAVPDVKVGDKITASVLIQESDDGFMILSLRDALESQGWDALEARKSTEETFGVKVVEANRGGLIVEADGLRGFLPVSQLAPENYPRVGNDKDEILSRLAQFEGKLMQVKVLDLDRNVNKLIFSERLARKGEFEELVSGIKMGETLEGKVSGVVDFGIFVSLGQLEGLVHISEISWGKVDHPSHFAKAGDKIKVQVIGIDEDKISLSMKRLERDPWLDTIKQFKVGQIVEATVTQIMPFGVFVSIGKDKVDGLIHISELAIDHVTDPETIVKTGDALKLKVIDLGPDSHRLGLSLKAVSKPTGAVVPAPAPSSAPAEAGELDGLGLSTRVIAKLKEAGITVMASLQDKSVEELEALPGIGKVTAAKIIDAVNN